MTGEAYRNGFRYSGWNTCHLSDRSTKWRSSESCYASADAMDALGISTADYRAKLGIASQPYGPPVELALATDYQNGYGWQRPMWLGSWEYSVTFGRWGRIVGFYDGWQGCTWPKVFGQY